MSILIKGLDMPRGCGVCPCYDYVGMDGDFPYCNVQADLPDISYSMKKERLKSCPLVEIPAHGALIDRDDLLEYITRKLKGKSYEEAVSFMYTTIKAYPTVIEAEL